MIDSRHPDQSITLLRAAWVASMDGTILKDAAVAFQGETILSVGSARQLRGEFPNAAYRDLGQAVLLPGLVNAHVHLELSALSPGENPASFAQWLKRLVPQTPPNPQTLRAFVEKSVEIGVRQCLASGVTTVGDISRQFDITRPLLKSAPLRVVSFGEVQAMAQRRALLDERLRLAIDRSEESQRLHIGVSPHAPYSVEADGYRKALQAALRMQIPLATHLAESAAEGPFLAEHIGEFRELWRYLDGWDEHVPTFAGGPIRFARDLGLLDYPALLAHVNYCDDDELAILAAGRASVVYCPRTHAYFGHPPHRFRDMLSAGINVAVGTDSCASSPNLNLIDDLRLIRKIAPDMPVEELWNMATVRAARAINREGSVGTLGTGKMADLISFDVTANDPLEEILVNNLRPTSVWIGGVRV